jgi:hypothetical protein
VVTRLLDGWGVGGGDGRGDLDAVDDDDRDVVFAAGVERVVDERGRCRRWSLPLTRTTVATAAGSGA